MDLLLQLCSGDSWYLHKTGLTNVSGQANLLPYLQGIIGLRSANQVSYLFEIKTETMGLRLFRGNAYPNVDRMLCDWM